VLITNHVLSGAVLGHLAPGVTSAAAAGFVSHFALDAVPHFGVDDIHLMRVAVPDGLTGLAVLGLVLARTPRRHRLRVAAGIAGACLPDLDKPGKQFFGRSPFPPAFDAFHSGIQSESPRRLPVEAAAAALCLAALSSLRRRTTRKALALRRPLA
jgi:hypothetical protein